MSSFTILKKSLPKATIVNCTIVMLRTELAWLFILLKGLFKAHKNDLEIMETRFCVHPVKQSSHCRRKDLISFKNYFWTMFERTSGKIPKKRIPVPQMRVVGDRALCRDATWQKCSANGTFAGRSCKSSQFWGYWPLKFWGNF